KIDEAIELSELAKRMGIKANEMIAKLMSLGVMATVNQTIDFETAVLVASEFEFEIEKASFEEEALLQVEDNDETEEQLLERAPVVTIMGHVDHGKTSLLDVIRKSKIASGETGGITQHIGAYNVQTANGGRVTFLDTPGHAAFTAMRSRGAQVTDIVILVVAADDGVMPQTIEAINHSKAAGVPVVVAVNKMDKPGADPTRIMREMSEHELLAEDWGGNVIFVQVSAKAETGIEGLLEMVLLQSEVLELKANPDRKAFGYVIESRLDIGRGAVATVLVMQGTLRDGDSIVCGLHSGRIRAMIDDAGNRTNEAGPSTPVEIVGLTGIPNAGDEFIAVASDKDAKQIANHRMQKQRAKELAKKSRANLEKMFEKLGGPEVKELRLIVKADVHGSIEALNDSLKDLAKKEVDIKIIHSATGTINESDVSLAAVSDAIIVGFNVRPAPQIRAFAKEENVDMRFYDIIYNVINDIQSALDGLMPSTFHENIIGRAEVRDIFVVPQMGTIAGCYIPEGKVIRGKKIRLLREGIIKCDTSLSSLRRFKDDVREVEQGFECGIGLEKYNDIKVGDIIECYEVEERKYKAG
ncbi:MAG: translation initiation factor IF-2, partial [Bacteroidetes bacterium]|nr:translation initiation factor IF-2 [Bacteroidota bacterium]